MKRKFLLMHTFAIYSCCGYSGTLPVVNAHIQSGEQNTGFMLEVAICERDKIKGLKGRHHLESGTGLVMLFDPPQKVSLWMKDTLIPLDIIFIDGSHQIVGLATYARPGSLELIDAPQPVAAAVELNAGSIQRWDIQAGDKLLFQPRVDTFSAECSS